MRELPDLGTQVSAPVGAFGMVNLHNYSNGTVQLIADVSGTTVRALR